ncbi:hypothetical protein UA08_02742 [Talaromyces atroroseus]|uniref:Uncharacterized protein n=1 Tax=Talaromyces atroroseus TaxID=1441469 RepID=A0A225B264_TALAT|nr:hypothetical protein UA08_02742 [Talaromyces atroroseus]OKL62059.1 hypothetical protein UA08_02742 [Talaromyces atroroseus]
MSSTGAGGPQGATRPSWQEKLKGANPFVASIFHILTLIDPLLLSIDHCDKNDFAAPVFHIVSDRRGGRTAWSATVDVAGRSFAARYWYDGQYINNAKEDASEVAIMALKPQAFAPQTSYQGQFYP